MHDVVGYGTGRRSSFEKTRNRQDFVACFDAIGRAGIWNASLIRLAGGMRLWPVTTLVNSLARIPCESHRE